MTVHVANFREPRLARPFVRCRRFVIEGRGDVIDPRVLRDVGIAEEILDGRTNPGLLRNPKRFQGRDPAVAEINGRILIVVIFLNLRPAPILLNEEFGGDVKIAKVCRALHSLSP